MYTENTEKGNNMEKHKPGEMDISVQTDTFQGFVKGIIYVSLFCIIVLLFLALYAT